MARRSRTHEPPSDGRAEPLPGSLYTPEMLELARERLRARRREREANEPGIRQAYHAALFDSAVRAFAPSEAHETPAVREAT